MEQNGYFFYCSDLFQKPLKIEFIPKEGIKDPKSKNDFDIEVEGKKCSLIKTELVKDASSIKYQKNVILLSRFFWLAFALAMCVFAVLALKLANFKMIYFAIGSLFFSIFSDFLGTKFTFKKIKGQNIKITLKASETKTCIFIPTEGNEEDLKELFPTFFDNQSDKSLPKNANEEFD